MKITRVTDYADLDRIINHPEAGRDPADLSLTFRLPHFISLIGDPQFGAHIALRVIEGVYEFHSTVLPKGRGEWAVEFSADAMFWMFTQTDCIELITRIPTGSLPAATLLRRFHFQPRWVEGTMRYLGREVSSTVWSLTLFEWIPSGFTAAAAVIAAMRDAGQGAKADAWHTRRHFVSREIE